MQNAALAFIVHGCCAPIRERAGVFLDHRCVLPCGDVRLRHQWA